VASNNYPQVISVTSESLQSQIRALLPSQEGFGTDLMAQNVIVPIIDLTAAAEGSTVRQDLQSALAFGSQTAFDFKGTSGVIANTTGFWRIYAASTIRAQTSSTVSNSLTMSDGLSVKTIWEHYQSNTSTGASTAHTIDIIVFLSAGESISGVSSAADGGLVGSARQIADINGTLVNPSGFNPQ